MKHVAIVTCIDPRLLPELFEEFSAAGAYIFRNGGARITDDVFRSITAAIRLGGVNEIILVMHTDCLFNKVTDKEIQDALHRNLGPCKGEFKDGHLVKEHCEDCGKNNRDFARNADYIAYATFTDLSKAVLHSIERLRQSPLISANVSLVGTYYDLEKNEIIEVVRSDVKP